MTDMTTPTIRLPAAETAHRDRAAFNVAKEIQRQTEGEWEPSIAQSFAILDAALDALRGVAGEAFQSRVQPWMMDCFGSEISADKHERNHRFLEEALELVQANGCTQHEAHQLVDYVYGRDEGEISQEVGGVMVTLAALCLAAGEDMHAAGEKELARVWTKVDQIRAKQTAKPKHSPLPQATTSQKRGQNHE